MTVVKYIEPRRDNVVLTALFFVTGFVLQSISMLMMRMFYPTVAEQLQQNLQATTSSPSVIFYNIAAMLVGYYIMASIAVWWIEEH